jgi:hypothetical protein
MRTSNFPRTRLWAVQRIRDVESLTVALDDPYVPVRVAAL